MRQCDLPSCSGIDVLKRLIAVRYRSGLPLHD
jgi:hypothetical protein